jgi:hypothetical protein
MSDHDTFPFDVKLENSNYSVFGESFFEQVPINHEPQGKLFWLNAEWFHSYGIDVFDKATRLKAEKWLLDTFSIQTCDANEPSNLVARADRYGGNGGTPHGGSGRCVYRGRFNVKGVGRTPLVPPGLSSHSNGEYLMVEAIRGVIYSELAHFETPKGAVPTIAIIQLPPFDLAPEDRRCLIIRPNFIRPAHFQRSLLFGTAGFKDSDQYKDNKRVKAVRQKLAELAIGWREIAKSHASAIGSLDAMRMSQGRYTSSNMSIEGKVADFETFRIFDSWFYTKNINRDAYPFGKELELLKSSAVGWSQLIDGQRTDAATMSNMLENAHREGFLKVFCKLIPSWGDAKRETSLRLRSFIYDIFLSHSRMRPNDSYEWMLDQRCTNADFCKRINDLSSSFGFSASQSIVIAARMSLWRLSRQLISLDEINATAEKLISQFQSSADTALKISNIISVNRRVFRFENDNFAPVSVVSKKGSTSVYVKNVDNGQHYKLAWRRGGGGLSNNEKPSITGCSEADCLIKNSTNQSIVIVSQ